MQERIENMGVWSVVAIVAAVVISYSLWGAAQLKASPHSSPFTTNATEVFTINS